MKNFYYLFGLVALLLVTGCGATPTVDNNAGNSSSTTTKLNVEVTKSYMLTDVATHAVATDCWLIINGKVYNVTDFINGHPGGQAILEGCGKDATSLFETRPMGSGTPHSSKANEKLSDFYIGDLK